MRVRLKLRTDFRQVAQAMLQVSFYYQITLSPHLIPIIDKLFEMTISIFAG